MSNPKESTREMADLLRSGAKMLSYSCPECGSPLFQLKSGEIWCARCQRRVVIVPQTEGNSAPSRELLWESLEQTLIDKVSSVNKLLSAEEEPIRMKELAEAVSVLLASIERLRRVRKS